jgi:hypothetical protein
MRRLIRAALGAAVLVFGAAAPAQGPTAVPATAPGVPAAGFEMPGTAVGRPSVQPVGSPVGTRLPTVGTQTPPAVGPSSIRNPFAGNWPNVDPSQVVAPFPTQQGPTADFWDKLLERWGALFDPPKPPQTTWVPGTTRRARERRERAEAMLERWRRD